MLKIYSAFAPFLFLTGCLALVASGLFLLLPRNPQVDDEPGPGSIERAEGGGPADARIEATA